ncbi:hypothetical protein G3573_02735, partial [Caulobacter sp. 17J65-9]|nr:hypothetical protein [Caulobacter sp. 17J65-9]
ARHVADRDVEPVERATETGGLPVPAGPVRVHAPEPAPGGGGDAFAAQLMGQGGQKRGLKGGKEVLDQARTTYLGTEYSGAADRRAPKGRVTKTEV